MKYLLSSVAIAALLAGSPALAANDGDKQNKQNMQSMQSQMHDKSQAQAQTNASIQFVTAQSPSEWLESELVGKSVQNPQGDTLGDINNVILDEQGRVSAVVIGVGGFLGLGEKDVGVPFEALEFRRDKADGYATTEQRERAEKDQAQLQQQADQQDRTAETSKSDDTTSTDRTAEQSEPSDRNTDRDRTLAKADEDAHDNIIIVLNATKEQLEQAPEYKYLGETVDRSDDNNASTKDASDDKTNKQ